MGAKRVGTIVTSDYSDQISFRNYSDYSDYKKSDQKNKDISTKRNRRNYSAREARRRAEYIAQKLDNPSRIDFYLKCAWNLTDLYLDRLLDISLRKENAIYYFSASASREMINNS